MPAIVVMPSQRLNRSEQMQQALKTHIMRERQRKKQGNLCCVCMRKMPAFFSQLQHLVYYDFSF